MTTLWMVGASQPERGAPLAILMTSKGWKWDTRKGGT